MQVLSSRTSLKAMEEDYTGRQEEEELRLKLINKLGNMGDLSEPSPVKKRSVEGEEPTSLQNKKKKQKLKGKKARVITSPAASGPTIKL